MTYLGFIWDLYVLGLRFNFFCKTTKDQILKTMDKGLTVPRWVLTVVLPKIPKMPLHFSAQFVCPSPNVWDVRKKTLSGRCFFYYVKS